MKQNILVLAGKAPRQLVLQVLLCLGEAKEFKMHVLCDRNIHSIKHSRWVSSYQRVPHEDSKLMLSKIIEIYKNKNIDLIIPINVDLFQFLITHQKELSENNIRTIRLSQAGMYDIANNKSKLGMFLNTNGLPHPKTYIVNEALMENMDSLTFPTIVKPSFGGGGNGIRICETKGQLQDYIKDYDFAKNPLIMQEYIQGYNLGFSAFCIEGKIHHFTIQKEINKKDIHDVSPSTTIEFITDNALFEVAQTLLLKLNWNGVAHIDIRYDSKTQDYKIIEINPRFWGSLLGAYHMGVNFPQICCNDALMKDIIYEKKKAGYYCTLSGYMASFSQKIRERGIKLKISDSPIQEYLRDPIARIFQLVEA